MIVPSNYTTGGFYKIKQGILSTDTSLLIFIFYAFLGKGSFHYLNLYGSKENPTCFIWKSRLLLYIINLYSINLLSVKSGLKVWFWDSGMDQPMSQSGASTCWFLHCSTRANITDLSLLNLVLIKTVSKKCWLLEMIPFRYQNEVQKFWAFTITEGL